MDIRQLGISFTNDASEEISKLIDELRLVPLAQTIQEGKNLSPELRETLGGMFTLLVDMFSDQLPTVSDNPEETLRAVSRDINLSRILRERGVFRMYILLNQKDEHGVPVYASIINPVMGHPFGTQDEFVTWFCEEAHVARSLLFQRIRLINRLLDLGISLESAFELVLKRPYIIDETVASVGNWEKGNLVGVDPDIAMQLAQKFAPDQLTKITGMIEDDDQEGLTGIMRPVIVELLEEVAAHERSKDARKWVEHDLLMRPEIYYEWDTEAQALVVELRKRTVNPETGEEALLPPVIVPFLADTLELPDEIKDDLLRRLPIRNRISLDTR